MKVLVTGGSGFIGQEIVKVLIERGFEVNILDIFDPQINGTTFFLGSVLDSEAISKAMFGCDYVFHMAAILGVSKASYAPVECLDVNILGTRNVLRCSVINRIKKIIFPSSSEVYGEPAEIPIKETTTLQPKSEYGVSKSVCEEYMKAYKKQHDLDYTIVRYFNVYGEKQRHSWVMPKFINNAVLGRELKVFGDGSQIRAFCHVRDAAEASVAALMSAKSNNNAFNIGNKSEPISMKQLAEKVTHQAQANPENIIHIPLEKSDRTKEREIFKRIPETAKAKEFFGFEAKIRIDEGIKRGIAFKKAQLDTTRQEVEHAEKSERVMVNAV
jgi:UDP-glucose 4-epimerase